MVFMCLGINKCLLNGMSEFKWILMLGSDAGELIKPTPWVNSKTAVALLSSSPGHRTRDKLLGLVRHQVQERHQPGKQGQCEMLEKS